MAYTNNTRASSSCSQNVSPNATSAPIPIPTPGLPALKPTPIILRDDTDKTPGLVHTPTKNITDFTPSHYLKMAKPSEKMFENANPVHLGKRVPPGCGPKPVVRRDVRIVPDEVPADMNRRAQNQWAWAMLEEIRMVHEAMQQIKSGKKSKNGEKSEGRSEGRTDSLTDSWEEGGYSVWE